MQDQSRNRIEATKEEIAEIRKQARMLANRKTVPGVDREDFIQEMVIAGVQSLPSYDREAGRSLGVFVRSNMEFAMGHLYAEQNRIKRRVNWRVKLSGAAGDVATDLSRKPIGRRDLLEPVLVQKESHERPEGSIYEKDNNSPPGYDPTPVGTTDDHDIDIKVYGLGLNENEVKVIRYIAEHGMDHSNPKRKAAEDLGMEVKVLNRIIKSLRGRPDFYDLLTT